LEAQNERLEEFSSVLSHDLRNAVNVAQGHLELARETGEDRHFDAVDRALGRIAELTDDLLALARTGAPVSDSEAVHLAGIAGECWATVPTDDATLVVDTDRTVSGNELRLKQLFENLFRMRSNTAASRSPSPSATSPTGPGSTWRTTGRASRRPTASGRSRAVTRAGPVTRASGWPS
jgi:light-regulated signal transduction histidine kinase (bacteriophytochrome)